MAVSRPSLSLPVSFTIDAILLHLTDSATTTRPQEALGWPPIWLSSSLNPPGMLVAYPGRQQCVRTIWVSCVLCATRATKFRHTHVPCCRRRRANSIAPFMCLEHALPVGVCVRTNFVRTAANNTRAQANVFIHRVDRVGTV